jgi:hypothetical protein
MNEEEKLKVRIEGLIKDPSISKKVLFEIDQYIGKMLLDASGVKLIKGH